MTADLLTGLCIGLIIGMGFVFLTNDIWYRDCTEMNKKWSALCSEMNTAWFKRCEAIRKGEDETYEKTVSSEEMNIQNVKESSEKIDDAEM